MTVMFVIAPKNNRSSSAGFGQVFLNPAFQMDFIAIGLFFFSSCGDVKNSTCKSFSSCFDHEDDDNGDDDDDEGDDGDCDKARRSLCFTFE